MNQKAMETKYFSTEELFSEECRLARFASANREKYAVTSSAVPDGKAFIFEITASKEEWEKIKKDFLSAAAITENKSLSGSKPC